ncbi:MAG: hypothetical protein ABR910_01550 [Acidobacteriaceae bacterium]
MEFETACEAFFDPLFAVEDASAEEESHGAGGNERSGQFAVRHTHRNKARYG